MRRQDIVKQLMESQNLNQKELSKKSGITRMDIIINFAQALGVTTDYLLSEDDTTSIGAYTEIATAIARNGKNLSAEEKNKLIALILGTDI